MELYKLTDKNGYTANNTYWAPGITHQVKWKGKMCQEGCLHAYTHPLIAVVCDPYHGHLISRGGKLFKAKGKVHLSDGTKVGCKRLTTIEEIPIPNISLVQKRALAILCAKKVAHLELKGDLLKSWNNWANNWLDDTDRSYDSARKLRTATATATTAAMETATATLMAPAMATAMATVKRAYEKDPSIKTHLLAEQAMKIQ